MMGLVYKNLVGLRSRNVWIMVASYFVGILIAAVFMGEVHMTGFTHMPGYLLIIVYILSLGRHRMGEDIRWLRIDLLMPLRRSQVIMSKYITLLILMMVSAVLAVATFAVFYLFGLSEPATGRDVIIMFTLVLISSAGCVPTGIIMAGSKLVIFPEFDTCPQRKGVKWGKHQPKIRKLSL